MNEAQVTVSLDRLGFPENCIVEAILVTGNHDGSHNAAPMGVTRDGTAVHEEAPCSRQTDVEWADVNCPAGDHFYYAHVKFSGEEYNPYWNIANAYGVNAWTSPVWVKRFK